MADYVKDYYNPNRDAMRQNAQSDYNSVSGVNQAATDQYLSDMNAVYEQAARDLHALAVQQEGELGRDYQRGFDNNAGQQAVNEREVAARMYRMGMTDSGLNGTQQAAVSLQRINADNALARQQNAQLGALRYALDGQLRGYEQNRLSAEGRARYDLALDNQALYNNLMQNADSKALSVAGTAYQAMLQEEAAKERARLEKQAREKAAREKAALEKQAREEAAREQEAQQAAEQEDQQAAEQEVPKVPVLTPEQRRKLDTIASQPGAGARALAILEALDGGEFGDPNDQEAQLVADHMSKLLGLDKDAESKKQRREEREKREEQEEQGTKEEEFGTPEEAYADFEKKMAPDNSGLPFMVEYAAQGLVNQLSDPRGVDTDAMRKASALLRRRLHRRGHGRAAGL